MLSALFVETYSNYPGALCWLYGLVSQPTGDEAYFYLPVLDWDKLSAIMPFFLQKFWGSDSSPNAYNEGILP